LAISPASVDHAYFYPGGQSDLLDTEITAVREMGLRQHAIRGCVPKLEGAIQDGIAAMRGGKSNAVTEEPDVIMAACERTLAAFHDPGRLSMVRVGVGPTMITYFHQELMHRLGRLADEANCDRQVHGHPAASLVTVALR
jgi:8-oxoguanine deaminase